MYFLIVDSYYSTFLNSFYAQRPNLAACLYSDQLRVLLNECFGTSGFYSTNLRQLGHQADEIIGNCEPLQRAWASEHGLPWKMAVTESRKNNRLLRILKAQIREIRPDILYLQNLYWPGSNFIREIRADVRLVVGQIAYGLNPDLDLSPFDLILTSFPHFVDRFRKMGGNSEYFPIAFEPRILNRLGPVDVKYPATFVGHYSDYRGPHYDGTKMLENIASNAPVEFWGKGLNSLNRNSPIRKHFHGEAWGLDMYRILAQSRICLNRHADWAENNANNMRLYEATGVGTMLITDYKDNLNELFEIGKEIIAFRNENECSELVNYYLEHDDERRTIALTGQKRTLNEHTYYHRMQELVHIVDYSLRQAKRVPKRCFPALSGVEAKPSILREWLGVVSNVVSHTPLYWPARSIKRQLEKLSKGYYPSHRLIVSPKQMNRKLTQSWKDPGIPVRQGQVVESEIKRMYRGEVVRVFQAAVDAIKFTGREDGTVVEVGCASGYYYEVLENLIGKPIEYIGMDYSLPLILMARQKYPAVSFVVGDATELPFADGSRDVLISGCVMLHVPDYKRVIEESARVSRSWCIFHRTPVVQKLPTTCYTKRAYGVDMVEFVFNEKELLSLYLNCGLEHVKTLAVGTYRVDCISEEVHQKTYICKKYKDQEE